MTHNGGVQGHGWLSDDRERRGRRERERRETAQSSVRWRGGPHVWLQFPVSYSDERIPLHSARDAGRGVDQGGWCAGPVLLERPCRELRPIGHAQDVGGIEGLVRPGSIDRWLGC